MVAKQDISLMSADQLAAYVDIRYVCVYVYTFVSISMRK